MPGCHGLGVFDKAVSSQCDNDIEEHGLTEDGKTVAPFSESCEVGNHIDSAARLEPRLPKEPADFPYGD